MSCPFHTHSGYPHTHRRSATLVNDLGRIRCPAHSSFSQVMLQARTQVHVSRSILSNNCNQWLTRSWQSTETWVKHMENCSNPDCQKKREKEDKDCWDNGWMTGCIKYHPKLQEHYYLCEQNSLLVVDWLHMTGPAESQPVSAMLAEQ